MRNRTFALLLSAMTATTFFVAPDAAQAQYRRMLKGNSYDELMQRARNQLEDARALKCYKSEAEREKYFVELNALREAITELMKSDYPQHAHEPLDPHIDRLDTVAEKIFRNLMDTDKCVPPGQQQGMTPPTPPAPPQGTMPAPPPAPLAPPKEEPPVLKGDLVAPEHSGLMRNDWSVGGEYASFDPKTGASADDWGVGFQSQYQIDNVWALDFSAAYNNVSGNGTSLNNWTVTATPVWYFSNGRVGPTVGYQNNSQSHFHSDTWNYGGFGEIFWPNFTLGGKAGGFNTDSSFSNSNGYYLGAALTGYFCPNFGLTGSVDYTHFSPFGGSSETDWGLTANWRPWSETPVTIWGGYTFSDFSPGSFSVNVISVGVRFDLGNGMTLIDSDRGGVIINQSAFTPLSLKF